MGHIDMDRNLFARCLRILDLAFTVLHLLLMLLFFGYDAALMAGINLVCLLAGAAGLWLLRREHFRLQMLVFYVTELLQMICFLFCVGWSAGLQYPLLGLTMLIFLAEYLGRSLGTDYLPALPVGFINFGVFLVLFPFHFHQEGSLALPLELVNAVQLLWSIPVFALMVAGMVVVLRVSSHTERLLTDRAQTDRLTGLYNRAGYDALRTQVDLKTTTLLLIDADKFKEINDSYGHEVGDRVLKKIAALLKQNFRLNDRVCRIGGDEFVVLMLDTEELPEENIAAKVSRINRELSHTAEDKLPLVSVSVGAAHGGEAEDWKELFNRADAALYEMKQHGRRGCRFYRPEGRADS